MRGSALDIGHLITSYFIHIAILAVTFRTALMSIINNCKCPMSRADPYLSYLGQEDCPITSNKKNKRT